MNDNRIELEQVVHTYRTSYQSGRLAERPVWCTKYQWVPAHARPYSFYLKNCSHCDKKWQKSIRYVMIHFSRSAAAQFRSLTEIAGKSPFFYMSRQKQNPVVFSCRCKGYLIIAFRVSHTPTTNLPHNSVATIQCYERLNRLG